MSTVKNNIGRGLNIALVNGELGPHGPKALCTANFRTVSTKVHVGLGRRGASLETHPDCVGNFQSLGKSGQLLKVGSFDMYSGGKHGALGASGHQHCSSSAVCADKGCWTLAISGGGRVAAQGHS